MDKLAKYRELVLSFRAYLEAKLGREKALLLLEEKVKECRLCSLSEGRKNVVFGSGSPYANMMVVGEAPGEEEDKKGKPFVGRAGELLGKMLSSVGIYREEVYITNVVKCRPPGNRDPKEEEIRWCIPYLFLQISILSPHIILTLGNFAAKALLQTDLGVSKVRGKVHIVNGKRILPTFHPSYLLRNPKDKRLVWEDMKLLREELSKLEL
jgi:DNA polymerase